MSGGPKIKASAARAHTRNKAPVASRSLAPVRDYTIYTPKRKRRITDISAQCTWGEILIGLLLISVAIAGLAWYCYTSILPPPPKICGTPGGPPVTAPRVQIRDGRYLAFKEAGVPKEKSKYKIIAVHGYGGSRHSLLGGLSEDLIEELRIYIVSYDRAGYGQSTPNPSRTVKTEAYDVQDLADLLNIGPKFYVAATSIGGYTGYALLKYLPHRLAGLVMFAPVTNFWWPGIPTATANAAWKTQVLGDRLALSVAHYAPWLSYWYMTQRVLPTSTTVNMERSRLAAFEKDIISEYYGRVHQQNPMEPTQQGKLESQYRDMKVVFGNWEFDPAQLENPFTDSSVQVHIYQGDADYLVPVVLQRYIRDSLPWVHYHEVAGAGHALLGYPGLTDKMIKSILLGHE